uniref:Uncharacterized protein n=1 Tax=Peronospora matthiolae TaxID=2874970 RepID=A0AAV1TZ75_9STRA
MVWAVATAVYPARAGRSIATCPNRSSSLAAVVASSSPSETSWLLLLSSSGSPGPRVEPRTREVKTTSVSPSVPRLGSNYAALLCLAATVAGAVALHILHVLKRYPVGQRNDRPAGYANNRSSVLGAAAGEQARGEMHEANRHAEKAYAALETPAGSAESKPAWGEAPRRVVLIIFANIVDPYTEIKYRSEVSFTGTNGGGRPLGLFPVIDGTQNQDWRPGGLVRAREFGAR